VSLRSSAVAPTRYGPVGAGSDSVPVVAALADCGNNASPVNLVATVTITHATITVGYTLTGDYVYNSGARIAGSLGGTYSGANSEDFQVTLVQTNLDGTPAAHPAVQQPATMLQFATVR